MFFFYILTSIKQYFGLRIYWHFCLFKLHFFLALNHCKTINFIIWCILGASTDIADDMGRTAFDYAKVLNKNGVLQLLTTRQANKKPNECNTDGKTNFRAQNQLFAVTLKFFRLAIFAATLWYDHSWRFYWLWTYRCPNQVYTCQLRHRIYTCFFAGYEYKKVIASVVECKKYRFLHLFLCFQGMMK